jgi:aminoglycoside phosphotransferase
MCDRSRGSADSRGSAGYRFPVLIIKIRMMAIPDEWRGRLPRELAALTGAETWQAISTGCAAAYVFRIGSRYLKIDVRGGPNSLLAEKERLEWLRGRLPVPAVLYYGTDAMHEYLLLSEIEGIMACDQAWREDMVGLVRLLAQGLRRVHSVDIASCPFDERLDRKLAAARERVEKGLVDEMDFDAERQGRRAGDLYEELLRTRPPSEDLVFTHGDFCLPNILIDRQHARISGLIDWGRAGIADRYQDIALAARSLNYNFGPGLEPLLFADYGLTALDRQKLDFYRLLDELF